MGEVDSFELLRVIAVIALLVFAAALATPKGRLPLAFRGLQRILRKDAGTDGTRAAVGEPVSLRRRLAAFGLVLSAVLLALI